jgi:dual specificity tyrosine-phosphorylation-regulated kinase 1
MEHDIALEKNCNILDVSSDLSNKSFLISPQNQKVLFQLTYEIEGIYQHIMRKDRRDKLKNLLRYDSNLKQGRYTVKKLIGRGSFGSVVQAVDNISGTLVAIKIVKPKYGWTIQTNNELANLTKVNQMETDNLFFVKMLDFFEENGYLCIVLELLEKTLYHFLIETKGMSLQDVEAIALQLFKALKALHSLKIVHCDLKPENIMIQGQGKKDIKVVDFGSSCIAGNSIYKFVQSRYYRSPEVALRIEYGMPIDVWSAGCIIAEMYIGRPLFESRSETLQMV